MAGGPAKLAVGFPSRAGARQVGKSNLRIGLYPVLSPVERAERARFGRRMTRDSSADVCRRSLAFDIFYDITLT